MRRRQSQESEFDFQSYFGGDAKVCAALDSADAHRFRTVAFVPPPTAKPLRYPPCRGQKPEMYRMSSLIVAVLLSFTSTAAQQQRQPSPSIPHIEPKTVFLVTGANMTALYHRVLCPWLNTGGAMSIAIDEAKKRYFQAHCLCIAGAEGSPPSDFSAVKPGVTSSSTAADLLGPSASALPATRAPATSTPSPDMPAAAPRETPRPAVQVTRCIATTQRGRQCMRNAQPGRSYCWQHGR